jgi:oligogalacturonide lyase
MKWQLYILALVLSILPGWAVAQTTQPALPGRVQTKPIPDEFIDPETKLRVIHLSRFPTDYASVIYFTYNTFSADSQFTLINAQFKDRWRYLYTFDLTSMKASPLVTDRLTQSQVVAAKSGNVYYMADNAAWVIPLKGGTSRKICDIPARWCPGVGLTVNADESFLLSGSIDAEKDAATTRPSEQIINGPNVLYTINLKTGELKVVHRDNKWFGHVQFSPVDPDLCMYCWEGNWAKVDRIWLINPSKSIIGNDGLVSSNARIAFHRMLPSEIAGHEFWHPNGKTIWFQHSIRGEKSAGQGLSSLDVATEKVTKYYIPTDFGGIHQSFAPDGTFLVSDGGGKDKTGPGKYLSRLTLPTDGSAILRGEHLVTLQDNDYSIEPNPHVSPDNRWVTFTATLHGTPQAYAVELPQRSNPISNKEK